AVLYRTNAQSAAFEEAFARADIPFRVRGAARFLDRPEVKTVLADLRTLASRDRDAPFSAHLQSLVGEATAAEGGEERRELADARATSAVSLSDADAALFSALVEWRKRLARASAVPAYVIFSDATLREIAAARPTSRVQLLDVHGVGPVKVERHGDAVLEIV